MSAARGPGRPDRVTGRPLSPRAFRPFGIEAVVLGPPSMQAGLARREGVGIWHRLPGHAALFDRVAGAERDAVAVRVLVVTTPARARALRVPAIGERAARVDAVEGPDGLPPAPGWLLLVDEGPGETWLYLAEDAAPEEALAAFIGRRGRTDFARARRRSRLGGIGSLGIFAALVLIVYAPALGLGAAGQVLGAALLALSVALLVAVRPR